MLTQDVIAVVSRGDVEESKHFGHIAAVDSSGKLLFSIGDPGRITFFRSALKPFQASVVVSSGAYKGFGFTQKELAFMASSHTSEPKHLECLEAILNKASLPQSALYCGRSTHSFEATGKIPTKFFHECSGKHAGLSAAAKWMGHDWHNYHFLHHPVQEMVFESITHYCDYMPTQVGIDGCGLPTLAIPLESMALGYARIAEEYGKTPVGQVAKAMGKHPWYVGGTHKFDSEIMKLTQGDIIVKKGAEGIACLSIPSQKIGIAIKCEDGAHRPIPIVVITLLERLGIFSTNEAHTFRKRQPHWHQILNSRDDVVGSIRSFF